MDPEIRALKVIAELLEGTRADQPEDIGSRKKSREEAIRWGDAMLKLAKEIPESSYAPYAASYAGWCYLAGVMETAREARKERREQGRKTSPEDVQLFSQTILDIPYYARATEALNLAHERADAYLKPLTLYQQALQRVLPGELDEAEALLKRALELGGKKGTVQRLVDKLHRDIARAKDRRSSRGGDED